MVKLRVKNNGSAGKTHLYSDFPLYKNRIILNIITVFILYNYVVEISIIYHAFSQIDYFVRWFAILFSLHLSLFFDVIMLTRHLFNKKHVFQMNLFN